MAEAKKKPVAKKAATTVKKTEEKAAKTTTKKVKELVEAELVAETIIETEKELDAEPKEVAKAGKRSSKALKEAEAKEEKEQRKAEVKAGSSESPKPKSTAKPARDRIERRSKNYKKSAKLIDKKKQYVLKEALELVTKTSTVKFDATVELHARLGVDPRQADQNIRGMVVLPGGTGKTVRIAVFAEADDVAKAKKAGADIAGSEEFLQQLDKEVIDFDVLIATPAMMAQLGKYARLLGPKGLMPNPKSGTVAKDVAKAVEEARGGKVEYRVDTTGIVHVGIGKVSFTNDQLTQNAQAVLSAIKGAKPASLKGPYVKSIFVTSTMGPSIQLENSDA